MQVVDEAAEQLGHDHDVVLERREPPDVEAGGGCVAGPHPESAVAGLFGHRGQFVAQIGEQSPVIRRVRQPLRDQVVVRGGPQDVDVNEDGDPSSSGGAPRPTRAMHRP